MAIDGTIGNAMGEALHRGSVTGGVAKAVAQQAAGAAQGQVQADEAKLAVESQKLRHLERTFQSLDRTFRENVEKARQTHAYDAAVMRHHSQNVADGDSAVDRVHPAVAPRIRLDPPGVQPDCCGVLAEGPGLGALGEAFTDPFNLHAPAMQAAVPVP